MSAILIPGMQAAAELRRTHERTFAIELKENDPFVLYLKLTPTQTLSVINGASIDIIIGSPVIQPNTVTFRLNDVIGAPFWISRTLEPYSISDYNAEMFSGLPYICKHLAAATHAQVALFDWNTRCIHTEVVAVAKPQQSLLAWAKACRTSQEVKAGRELECGYVFSLMPLVTRPDFIYTNIAVKENLGDKPYLVSTNKYSDWLYTSGYLEEGKHGYYQEIIMSVELAKYFRAGVDLFISPRLRGEAELTDFIIAAHGVIVLIESKASSPFVGTPRKPNTVERSFTKLIHKAFEQLLTAQRVITENPALLEDQRLFELCVRATEVVSICIVDDALMINPRSLKTSLNDLHQSFEKRQPYILELEDFFGLLAHSKSAKLLIGEFTRLARSLPPDADIPLFHIGF
jgi:hypothetical protein